MKTRRLLFIITFVIALTLLVGCVSNPEVIIVGKLVEQKVHSGFFYDTYEYKLSMSDNPTTTYTFKVRGGWPMTPNQIYTFRLEHIEKDEFIAISVEQK